jgi:haloalkane dehalogenase
MTWLNKEMYPFDSHRVTVPDGDIHYVDEGSGDVIVMVHGTPTWSFLYRHLITALRAQYRVIALDLLGSGLSDKPDGYSYRPEDQARNLQAFIQRLDLQDITLMVHDFGGPIGLSYAINHPRNVRRLVLFNTWMWSLKNDPQIALVGRLIGSKFGRFLYRHLDFEFKVIVPSVYADRSKLTPAIEAHYRAPFEKDENGTIDIAWIYARELLGSSDWFHTLWEQRDTIQDIPALLLWGMQDRAFGPPQLKRWRGVFTDAEIHELDDSGHFVQEEKGAEVAPIITDFLGRH